MSHTAPTLITIDGPGGSGKDTLAENLQEYLATDRTVLIANTGNFSRSIAFNAVKNNIGPEHPDFTEFAIHSMNTMQFFEIDPTYLFTPDVEKIISNVAGIPEIRQGFKTRFPLIIEEAQADIVLVLGRITGSILPQAVLKLYLETSPDICAQRRALARSRKGENYDAVYQALLERNKADLVNWNKDTAMPEDTVTINTDHLSQQDVFKTAQVIISRKNLTF